MKRWLAVVLVLSGLEGAGIVEAAPGAEELQFFEKKIRPLLAEHCYRCHSAQAKKVRAGLVLDSREGVLKGGDSGPALVPGHPEQSLLMKAVGYGDLNMQMPPSGKLPEKGIALLADWIRRGAAFPETKSVPSTAATKLDARQVIAQGRKHWAFQALANPKPPTVRNASKPLDGFILAELEKKGLSPAPPASKQVLVRRVYFDIIGLPPTPQEVDDFVNDPAPDAYARLVDKLLRSPHHGERWARFWLDLARYCDISESWNESKASPWLYRDWVVHALNEDVPYDQFIIKQLAADQLANPQPEDYAALGFIGLSPTYWKELNLDKDAIKGVVADEWEERIHTLSSTFLGLTAACARCHDHKFDPITVEDYYGLAGIFASTKQIDRAVVPEKFAAAVDKARKQTAAWQSEIDKLKKKKGAETDKQVKGLQAKIAELKKTTPHFDAPIAPAVGDAALYVLADGPHRTKLQYKMGEPQNVAIHIRGVPANTGATVPRRFLEVLSPGTPRTFSKGSGRLELAQAIVSDAAPLAARVFVNRIWKLHFGTGLVETPSDFGTQGDHPSNPGLLDHLARGFIEHSWSIRWLHREILLSNTYRQSSSADPAVTAQAEKIDPDNRLYWRMNRRRLEVEAWRDAMLAANGTLDKKIGGPPADLGDANNRRRTIYGTIKRRELSDVLRLHDFPDPTTHNPTRIPTTTPLQQLFTLNSPFLQQQAKSLVAHLKKEQPVGDETRVRLAYLLLFNRPPTTGQLRLGLDFLGPNPAEAAWEQYAQVLLGSNEFLYVD